MCSRSACTADPMNIVFQIAGNIIIENMSNPLYIKTTGSDIRCHKHLRPCLFKLTNNLVPLTLAHISMNFIDNKIRFLLQTSRQFMGTFTSIAENDSHIGIHLFQMTNQQGKFMCFYCFINTLLHRRSYCLFRHVRHHR